MASKTRLYEVTLTQGEQKTRLVEATSQSAAWHHVARKFVGEVDLPNGKRIAELMAAGIKVEAAEGGE